MVAHALDTYHFVVVGAGPAGLTAVANLLDNGIASIAWIDPTFSAGRLGERFTQVPSNTNIQLFLDYVKESRTLLEIVKEAPRPNAYSALEGLVRDRGAVLQYAADLLMMLTEGVVGRHEGKLAAIKAKVQAVDFVNEREWIVAVDRAEGPLKLKARKIVLATGSEPAQPARPLADIPLLEVETALSPDRLGQQGGLDHVAVVGSSHSAMMVLKNLAELVPTSRLVHVYRSELKFAEPRDGWMLHDNTGLKGAAAAWARSVYPAMVESRRIVRCRLTHDDPPVLCAPGDQETLQACSRIVYAIGYRPSKTLDVLVDGAPCALKSNSTIGQFDDLPLFGCGIAFPQRVVDPAGNVEMAVGIFKFMKYLKYVVPHWIQL